MAELAIITLKLATIIYNISCKFFFGLKKIILVLAAFAVMLTGPQ